MMLTIYSSEEISDPLPDSDPPVTPGEKLECEKHTESTTLDTIRALRDAKADMEDDEGW